MAVADVRRIYDDLDLQGAYQRYESEALEQLRGQIAALKLAPAAPFELVLSKLVGRDK